MSATTTPNGYELRQAYLAGYNAVAEMPRYSPNNPHDQDTAPGLYEAWEAGATEAGWNDLYHNGELVADRPMAGYPTKPRGFFGRGE